MLRPLENQENEMHERTDQIYKNETRRLSFSDAARARGLSGPEAHSHVHATRRPFNTRPPDAASAPGMGVPLAFSGRPSSIRFPWELEGKGRLSYGPAPTESESPGPWGP